MIFPVLKMILNSADRRCFSLIPISCLTKWPFFKNNSDIMESRINQLSTSSVFSELCTDKRQYICSPALFSFYLFIYLSLRAKSHGENLWFSSISFIVSRVLSFSFFHLFSPPTVPKITFICLQLRNGSWHNNKLAGNIMSTWGFLSMTTAE